MELATTTAKVGLRCAVEKAKDTTGAVGQHCTTILILDAYSHRYMFSRHLQQSALIHHTCRIVLASSSITIEVLNESISGSYANCCHPETFIKSPIGLSRFMKVLQLYAS